MSFNPSDASDSLCLLIVSYTSDIEIRDSTNYRVIIIVACVVTALLAPMTVAGNTFILAAIWKNPSLRAPSYFLLAGLAFTDCCTGLLSQPFFIFKQVAAITGNKIIYCIIGSIADIVSVYFSSLTLFGMTLMAVERWLHMSDRSLLTVRRVTILYIIFAVSLLLLLGTFFLRHMYISFIPTKAFFVLEILYFFGGGLCIIVTAFAYFKVFQIIRHHYNQVQANSHAIDMQKFKKSVFTILYILAIFVLSYIPYLCCILVFQMLKRRGTKSAYTAINVCAAVLLSSSCFNSLLYYWRIKEMRDSVKSIARKLCRKENEEQS